MKEFSSSVRVSSLTIVEEKFGFKSFVMPQSEGFSFMNIYFEGQRKNIIRMMFIRIPYPKNYHENIRFITNIRKLRTMLLQPSPPLGPTYYRAIWVITARHNLWQPEFSPKNQAQLVIPFMIPVPKIRKIIQVVPKFAGYDKTHSK